jgi:hypothetical protein
LLLFAECVNRKICDVNASSETGIWLIDDIDNIWFAIQHREQSTDNQLTQAWLNIDSPVLYLDDEVNTVSQNGAKIYASSNGEHVWLLTVEGRLFARLGIRKLTLPCGELWIEV